jgi:hypothetical protein
MKGVVRSLTEVERESKKANGKSYEDWVLALKTYKETHHRFPTDRKLPLGNWLRTQRKLKRKVDRGEPAGGMSFQRVSMLNELGIVWNPGGVVGGRAHW